MNVRSLSLVSLFLVMSYQCQGVDIRDLSSQQSTEIGQGVVERVKDSKDELLRFLAVVEWTDWSTLARYYQDATAALKRFGDLYPEQLKQTSKPAVVAVPVEKPSELPAAKLAVVVPEAPKIPEIPKAETAEEPEEETAVEEEDATTEEGSTEEEAAPEEETEALGMSGANEPEEAPSEEELVEEEVVQEPAEESAPEVEEVVAPAPETEEATE